MVSRPCCNGGDTGSIPVLASYVGVSQWSGGPLNPNRRGATPLTSTTFPSIELAAWRLSTL